jgi:hypothetical protein
LFRCILMQEPSDGAFDVVRRKGRGPWSALSIVEISPLFASKSSLDRERRYDEDKNVDTRPRARNPRIHLIVSRMVHGTQPDLQSAANANAALWGNK